MKKLLIMSVAAMSMGVLSAAQYTDAKGQTWTLDRVMPDNPTKGSGEYVDQWWIRGVKPAPTGAFAIPDRLGAMRIYGVSEEAFAGENGIASVSIGSGVRQINYGAFRDATNLTSVTVSGYLENIAGDAFENTPFMENSQKDGVNVVLGGHLYRYFAKDASFTVPAEVKVIDEYAFYNAPANDNGEPLLRQIAFNDGLEKIGEWAFEHESGTFRFKEVAIPDSVVEIGYGAFWNCAANSLKIGNGVTDLEWMYDSFVWLDMPDIEPTANEPVGGEGSPDFALAPTLTGAAGKAAGTWQEETSTWWHWTAPSDGFVAFGTKGSDFDTLLTVWTGTADEKTEIAEDDDFYEDCTSKVVFSVEAGVTYHIEVCGYGESGQIELRWQCETADDVVTGIKSVEIGNGVASIPSGIFDSDTFLGLKTLTVGSGLRQIEDGAFAYCYNLTRVDLSRAEKLATIGSKAFYDCDSLQEVVFNEGLKTIGSRAFYDCESLKTLAFPATLQGIESAAFQNCSGLVELTFPGALKTIGNSAFAYCASITNVTFNEGLESIGAHAFEGPNKLTELAFPSTLKTIGGEAFAGCENLSGVALNDGLEYLGSGAFACWDSVNTNLTSVAIPASVMTIEGSLFEGCTNLTEITGGEGVIATGYSPFGSDVPAFQCREFGPDGQPLPFKLVMLGKAVLGFQGSCPSELTATNFGDVVSIGSYAFDWSSNESVTNLTAVAFPDSVLIVGDGAFCGAENLTAVQFPADSSKLMLGWASFSGTGIAALEGSFCSIGAYAFSGCESLKRVEVTANGYVGDDYLGGAAGSISIDGGVGESAFAGCTNLEAAVVICTNKYGYGMLGYDAFDGCTSLKEVRIVADSMDSIGECASLEAADIDCPNAWLEDSLWGCGALKRLTLNVGGIDDYALGGMELLAECAVGDSVTYIGNGAFAGCTNLTTLTGCESVREVGEDAFADTALFGAEPKGALVTCGILAKYVDADGETAAVVPDGVRVIAAGAFAGSSVAEITFPATVACIRNGVVYGCDNLARVICKNPDMGFESDPEYWSEEIFGQAVEVVVLKGGARPVEFAQRWFAEEGDWFYVASFGDLRFHNDEDEDGDFVAGSSYTGWLMDEQGHVLGTITVKTSKADKKTGESKVTATIQLPGWKKVYTAQFKVGEDGKAFIVDPDSKVASVNPLNGMFLGGNWLSGDITFEGNTYAVRGGNAAKNVASFDAYVGHVWAAVLSASVEDDDLATANGYSTLTFTPQKKGKVKIDGSLADGTKVSATAQMVAGDNGVVAAPVSVPLYTGKKGGFSFLLKFFMEDDGVPRMTLASDYDSYGSADMDDGTLGRWVMPYTYANAKAWTSLDLCCEKVAEVDTTATFPNCWFDLALWSWYGEGVMLTTACKGFEPLYGGVLGKIDAKGKWTVGKAAKWSILTAKQRTTTYAEDIADCLSSAWLQPGMWWGTYDGKYLMPYEGVVDSVAKTFSPTDWFLIDEGAKFDKKTGKVTYQEIENDYNVKVTYTKKTGMFSGSSAYYWVDETNPQKHSLKTGKFTLNGVILDGEFFGAAVAKGIESLYVSGNVSEKSPMW